MFKSKPKKLRFGFTMIETLVAIGVLGMFFAAIAFILQQVLLNIGESRARTTALALAQAKMETIRNLPYNQVGTSGGIPIGPILQIENVVINGQTFAVNTSIIYVDDPFDQLVPSDLVNTDYKRARIEVTWTGAFPSRTPVTLVTNIVPKGVETTDGGGTLYIRVYDSGGLPVNAAKVKVDNTVVNPQIHTETLTNVNGLVVLPGSPPCVNCYEITVSKTGLSTDKTYGTNQVANPLQPHATVIEGQIAQLSFTIDTLATLQVNSVNTNYNPVANVQFTLIGNKIIGTTTTDEPVYKYQFSTNTGGGTVSIPALEWDIYTLDFSNSFYNLAGSTPLIPFALTPGEIKTVTVVATPKTNTSLLVAIQNANGELQSSVSAQLTNINIGYDVTKVTPATGSADFGQVFFGSLTPETYDLKVTLSGYQEATASLILSGIEQQIITLNSAQ